MPTSETLSEERVLRMVLLAGVAATAALWLMETTNHRIAAWDRIAYPFMLAAFASGAATLTWAPRHAHWVRLGTTVVFNGYLLLCLHMVLFGTPGATNMYQFVACLYWTPMGFGTAFIFLNMRAAISLSLLVYACIFAPIVWCVVVGPLPQAWPPDVLDIMSNVAVAQVVYLVLLPVITRLRQDVNQTRAQAQAMEQAAATDELTGLANRRALGVHLGAGLALVQRDLLNLSVMLVDVDHFKRVNDTRGHAVGDEVLVELAQLLAAQLRASDRIGRWGGEEFLIVAPATPLSSAAELAERLRLAVAQHDFACGAKMTISVGVSACDPSDTVEQLIGRADAGLYTAKQAGRNRVGTQPARA